MGKIQDSLVWQSLVASGGNGGGGGGGGGSAAPTAAEVYAQTRPADWMVMPEPEEGSVYILFLSLDHVRFRMTASTTDGSDMSASVGVTDSAGNYSPMQDLESIASGKTVSYDIDTTAADWAPQSGEIRQVMMCISGSIASVSVTSSPGAYDPAHAGAVEVSANAPAATSISLSAFKTIQYVYYVLGEVSYLNVPKGVIAVRRLAARPTNLGSAFEDCSGLIAINMSELDTSSVTTISRAFDGCSALQSLDVSRWDTSRCTSFVEIFRDCSSLRSLDLSRWDTSHVTDLRYAFYGCSSLRSLDLSRWDTSHVTDLSYAFYGCSSLRSLDLSRWDTSHVTDMSYTFGSCSTLQSLDVSGWDVSQVTTMLYAFTNCTSLLTLDLSRWIMAKVGSMSAFCSGNTSLQTLLLGPIHAATTMSRFVSNTSLRRLRFDPSGEGWAGCDISLTNTPMTISEFAAMIDSLPAITTQRTISVTSYPFVADITDDMIAAAAAKNWVINTGAATTAEEPDIPAEQALAIITGEEA